MKSIKKKLWGPGTFLMNVTALFSGNLPGHLISLAIIPFVTRLYEPEDIGIAGLIIVFVNLASTITTFRYEFAIVNEKSTYKAIYVLQLCLILSIPLSLIASTSSGLFIYNNFFGFEIVPYSSLVLIFAFLLLATQLNALRFWFIRLEQFRPISQQIIGMNIIRAILLLLLGYLKPSWWAYIAAEVASRFISIYIFLKKIPKKTWEWKNITRKKSLMLMKKHKDLPKINMPSTFIDTLSISLPIPFIADIYGAESAGFFVLMHKIVLGTSSIAGAVVADAFHGRLAKHSRINSEYGLQFFMKTFLLLVGIGIIPLLILLSWSPLIFSYLFGTDWEVAGQLARVAAPWAFFQLVVSPLSRVVFIYNWQSSKLIYDLSVLTLTALSLFYSMSNGFDILQLTVLLTAANTVCYILYFAILFYQLKYKKIMLN